jgi:hypothetical protein
MSIESFIKLCLFFLSSLKVTKITRHDVEVGLLNIEERPKSHILQLKIWLHLAGLCLENFV